MKAARTAVWFAALLGVAVTAVSAQPLSWAERVAQSREQFGVSHASEPTLIEVDFAFTPEGEAATVHLTGSFAGWGATAVAMSDADGDGTWAVTHGLRPGRHLYKFVVDGSDWRWDPLNPDREDDGHQGFNSVLHVSAHGLGQSEEGAHDGHVTDAMILHDPADSDFLERTGEREVQVNISTLVGDVEAVDLIFGQGESVEVLGMDWTHADQTFDHWRADLDDIDPNADFAHLLAVRDGDDTVAFGVTGATRGEEDPTEAALPFVSDLSARDFREVPAWAMDAVWYQIFPERFRNGDPNNDEPNSISWTHHWHTPVSASEEEEFYHYVFERKFGGDLQGIQWALDYLDDLGVTALYLNPVFESISLHKYDTWDYRHIDDNFGVRGDLASVEGSVDPADWTLTPSDQIFLDLVEDVHGRDMRIIVDGVFNHSGHGHWAFRDVVENGADSEFADWYKITSWDPFNYDGWAGERDLPEFAQDENGLVQPVADHFMNITRRWMDPDGDGDLSDGIDGWRLDVPNLIAKPFWRAWNDVVDEANPEAYTVGELWGRDPDWTTPDLFDAHMNYAWLTGVYRFFVNDDPEGSEPVYTPTELNAHMFDLHGDYDYRTNFAMQNLLDSHDTDRIASALLNRNRALDAANRVQDGDGAGYDQSKPGPEVWQRLRLIFLYQFTSVGAPMIWYGDEVGMWGADDPETRKPMLWDDLMPYDHPEDRPNTELREWVRTLAHLRAEHEALRRGHLRPALLDDDKSVYAYTRRLHGTPSEEDVLVAIHRGEGNQLAVVPVEWPDGTLLIDAVNDTRDPLTVRSGRVVLTLGPDEGAVLVTADEGA